MGFNPNYFKTNIELYIYNSTNCSSSNGSHHLSAMIEGISSGGMAMVYSTCSTNSGGAMMKPI